MYWNNETIALVIGGNVVCWKNYLKGTEHESMQYINYCLYKEVDLTYQQFCRCAGKSRLVQNSVNNSWHRVNK